VTTTWLRILGADIAHAVPAPASQISLCGQRSVNWVPSLGHRHCRSCETTLAKPGALERANHNHAAYPLSEDRRDVLEALFLARPLGLRLGILDERVRVWMTDDGVARLKGDPPRWYITERGIRLLAANRK